MINIISQICIPVFQGSILEQDKLLGKDYFTPGYNIDDTDDNFHWLGPPDQPGLFEFFLR